MTARPVDPGSRRRPLYTAVALVLAMVAVLLAAGCIGGDIRLDQDLAIIKLNQDGSIEWMKMINSGKDDEVTDVIQTTDGGYTVAGGYSTSMCNKWSHFPTTPKIIRLSDKGDIIWEKEYISEMTDKAGYADPILGLVQKPDTGYYLISEHGSILNIGPSGIFSSRQLHDTDVLKRTDVKSIFRTRDGGSVIAGFTFQCRFNERIECPADRRDFQAFIEKLDPNGNSSWFRTYEDQDFFIVSQIIELNDDRVFVSIMESAKNESLVILDKNGVIQNSSFIGQDLLFYRMQPKNDGFVVFCLNRPMNFTYENYYYTSEGVRTRTISAGNNKIEYASGDLNSTTGMDSMSFLILKSGQFAFSARPETNISLVKKTGDGKTIWEQQLGPFSTDNNHVHIRHLIGTSDGGYLIVLGIEKTLAC